MALKQTNKNRKKVEIPVEEPKVTISDNMEYVKWIDEIHQIDYKKQFWVILSVLLVILAIFI